MSKYLSTLAVLTICGACFVPSLVHCAEPDPPTVRFLVPAYFYPSGEGLATWDRLLESSARAPIVAIVNPASGPGKKADENYLAIFKKAKATKITLVGYVTLSYAKRPLADVQADVETWLRLYPGIQGIFFDEQPSGAADAPFVAKCCDHVRSKIASAKVFTNPGTSCAKEYLSGESPLTACLFEGKQGFDDFRLPDWSKGQSRDQFCVLLYNTPSADQMRKQFAAALDRGAGYLFITSADGANPWDRLPPYWEDELAEAEKANRRSRK